MLAGVVVGGMNASSRRCSAALRSASSRGCSTARSRPTRAVLSAVAPLRPRHPRPPGAARGGVRARRRAWWSGCERRARRAAARRAGRSDRGAAMLGSLTVARDRRSTSSPRSSRSRSWSRSTSSSATPASSRSGTSASSPSAPSPPASSRSRASRRPATMPNLARFCATRRSATSRRSSIAAAVGGLFALLVGLALMRLSGLAAGIATFRRARDHEQRPPRQRQDRPRANVFSSVPETTDLLQATVGALSSSIASRSCTNEAGSGGSCGRPATIPPRPARWGSPSTGSGSSAFAISGLLAGFAGGLYVHLLPTGADSLYLDLTFITLAMLVIGGDDEPLGRGRGGARGVGLDSLLAEAEKASASAVTIDLPAGTRLVVVGFLMGLVLVLRPSGLTGGREFSLSRLDICARSVLPSHEGRRHEDLRGRLRCRRVAVRGKPRDAGRRRGVGVRPQPGARRRDRA